MISYSRPVSGTNFVDRKDILLQLNTAYPHQNAALVGPRRIGKSSIAEQFLSTLDAHNTIKFRFKVNENIGTPGKFAIRLLCRFLNAYMSISHHDLSADEIEVNPAALFEIADQLNSNTLKKLAKLIANYFPPVPENERYILEKIIQFMESFSIETNLKSAIVLDEFQDIEAFKSFKNFENGNLLAFFSGLFSKQTRVWYLFTGSAVRMMLRILEDKDSPFYGRVRRINVRKFGKDDTLTLIHKCIQHPISSEAFNMLFSLTSGHPFYTVVIATAADIICGHNSFVADRMVEQAFVEELTGGGLDTHCNHLFENSFSRVKSATFLKELLRELVKGEGTQAELARRLGRVSSHLSPSLRNLLNLDLIEKRKRTFCMSDPILSLWLESVYSQTEPKLKAIKRRVIEDHVERIASLRSEIGIYFESYMRELLQKFDRQSYKGIRLPRFVRIEGGINLFDHKGYVMGKPSNIEIDAFCEGDENWICEFKYRQKNVSPKDMEKMLKKKEFIKEQLKMPIHKIMYVAKASYCEQALISDMWCLSHQELNDLRAALNLRKIKETE